MEGRVDRYASSRNEENHRRGSALSQQLETGQRESTSLDKEMEGRVDRYASGRDTFARDTPHNGKESSSTYDWKRRERSSGTQWSPPFTSTSSSVQDGSGRFHSGFDLPTGTNSPQPSPFAGGSSLLGTESVHDETSHMSPPKRPRPGWGEATDSGHDDTSHSSQPKRPRLGWGQGLAKYERKKGTDGEDCSKSAGLGKEENIKKSNLQSEEEISVERTSRPGSHVSPGSTSRLLSPEIGSDKPVPTNEGEVHKSEVSNRILELSSEPRPSSTVQVADASTSEAVAVPPEALGPYGDSSITMQASDYDTGNLLSRGLVHGKDSLKDSSQEQGLQESLGPRLVPGLVGLQSDGPRWSKEAITQQLMKVEAELEVLEKELAKLARVDDGESVEKSIQTGTDHVDEQHKDEQSGSPRESAAPNTKASDSEEVEVTPVVGSLEVPTSPVADERSPNVSDQAADPQVIPSTVEESSLSQASVQEGHTEASCPSKSDSDYQTHQDSDDQMHLALNSEHCDSFIYGCHEPDAELCELNDEEDFSLVTNYYGLSDLMFYLFLLSVWSLIMENRRLARLAIVPLQHMLSKDDKNEFNGSIEVTSVWIKNEESHSKIREKMQEKLSERKKLVEFKEHFLAWKYRTLREELHHIQAPGMFQRRDRVKPVRRWEVDRRNAAAFALTSQRSTLRLRPVIGGPTRLYTGQEDGQMRRKSLANTPVNQLRHVLKMPAMILDEKERWSRRFVNTNGLVEDPVTSENERKSVNPWTEEEKSLFMEKFPLSNKNFSKIASYFENKTTADCIEFYYRNQKSEEFEKIKRRRQQLKKRRDYSLSGSFLATLPPSNSFGRSKDVNSSRVEALTLAAYAASRDCVKAPRGSSHKVVEKARPVITYDSGNLDLIVGKSVCVKEIKAVSTDVKDFQVVTPSDAGSSGISPCSLSIGTPSTSKNCREKLSVKGGSAFIPPFSKVLNVEELGDRKGIRTSPGVRDVVVENEDTESQWTDFERNLFLEAVSNYGKDFKSISERVVSKTIAQCRTFFSKIRKRFRLDELAEQASQSGAITVKLGVSGFHTKSAEYAVDVKIDEVHDSALENFRSIQLGPGGIQQDRYEVEGMCKVEVVEGTEMESGLSLLGKAVEDQQLIDQPAGRDDETNATEDCAEGLGGKSEDVIVAVVPTADEQKQPEQTVKVERETDVAVVENLIRVQKDVGEICTVKDEGERVESGVEYGETTWKEAKVSATSTSLVDACSALKAHEEDLGPRNVVIKAEPILSLDSVGPGMTGVPLVTTQQTASIPVTSQPVTQGVPLRERGTRVNAAGEFKPRREPTSWTQEEKEKFAEIIRRHGKDWTLLDESLPGKSMTQIKTYFQNSKAKLGFLSTDNLPNSGVRGSCNRKRKPEESDTSSNAGSAGQICPPKVSISSEDVLQKVASSSMMTISSNIGTSGVGAEGMGFSHFNPCPTGEDSATRDLQKMIRRMCSGSDYGAQPNLVAGLMPLFQPGVTPSYSGPNPQQSLLLATQKQQLMVGHPSPQQLLPQQVGLQKQQQSPLTPQSQQQLMTHVVQHLQQAAVQQLQQQQQQQQQQAAAQQQLQQQAAAQQQLQQQQAAVQQLQQQQAAVQQLQQQQAAVQQLQQQQAAVQQLQQQQAAVQQLQQQQAAVQQLQQQQQQTNQLAVHQPQQMVHQLQQLVQLQQQQQQHLAQVAKHVPPQLLHQQSHQHIPLGGNVHQQQMVSRAKLAAGVQQQGSHVSRLHPSHSQQQQLFQQQKQILQQQKQHQLILQQIQATQLQHDLLHQQMQAQKQQQLPQLHLQQQQAQLGQPLSLFRGPYQNALAEAELLRHSEAVEQRSTTSQLGLLPREELQVQSHRSQQVLVQQQQMRAPSSSESQRLRSGDIKLFGQSLLSQPQQSSGPPSISSSHKTFCPASTVPSANPTNSASKAFLTEPSVLAPPSFNRPGGTAIVGEGSQSWPVASAGNLDLWSMMGGLQGGVPLYKNEDASKSESGSVHGAVTKITARLSREGHDLDGDDMQNALVGVVTNDHQRSTDGIGDIIRIGAAEGCEVSNEGQLRMESEWRSIPRPKPIGIVNPQAGYSHVVLDPIYTYSGERQSGNSQIDVPQTWEGLVLERESSRNAVESGIGNVVTPSLISEVISQEPNHRGEVYSPLSLPLSPGSAVTKMSSGSLQWSVSGSLPHPGDSLGGPSFQPQVVMIRGLPEVEQPCSLTSDPKSKNVDNSGGPG